MSSVAAVVAAIVAELKAAFVGVAEEAPPPDAAVSCGRAPEEAAPMAVGAAERGVAVAGQVPTAVVVGTATAAAAAAR